MHVSECFWHTHVGSHIAYVQAHTFATHPLQTIIASWEVKLGHQYPNCLDLNKHFQFVFFHDFKNAPVEFLVSNCGSKRDKLATFGASHVHYFERCARNLLMVKGRKQGKATCNGTKRNSIQRWVCLIFFYAHAMHCIDIIPEKAISFASRQNSLGNSISQEYDRGFR